MRDSWETDQMYVILNPLLRLNKERKYSKLKKIENIVTYSSDRVDKIQKDDLKRIIHNAGLI
jgi:hypothetical protein